MATPIFDSEVQAVLDKVQTPSGTLFSSPEDWRDNCIYFLMVDRFNNSDTPPENAPFDAELKQFQEDPQRDTSSTNDGEARQLANRMNQYRGHL
jgi:hypothetical protein